MADFSVDELRAALRGAGLDVWQWDLDSDALSDEDLAYGQLGYAPGEVPLTQAAWSALIHPEDLPRHDATYRRYLRGETPMWECVYRIRAKDGHWRHFEERGRFVAWHADGRPRRMMGTQCDVTEREHWRAEAERAQRAMLSAQAASRAKTDFLSRLSHELRTPLNAVLGFAQLMQADRADPPSAGQRRRLALVVESGQHLLRMIGDLLDLTRAESGRLPLRSERIELAAALRDAASMLEPQAAAAGVAVHLPSAPLPAVQADATRLHQVLLNLLGNAVKYNRPGGAVHLGAAAAADGVWIEVRDTGVGIPAEELPHVFEPFWRSALAQRAGEGTGIGLAVTASLVQAMGGQVEARSEHGRGSVFRVRLPQGSASLQSAACIPSS